MSFLRKISSAFGSLKNRKGMTLVEIMIVLAILGSLLAILAPQVVSRLNKSKVGTTKLAMGNISQALSMYYNDCSKYPASLEGLSKADADCANWGPEPYLKTVPKDGWNKDFVYSPEGSTFTLISLGADNREGGDGYNKDISLEDVQ